MPSEASVSSKFVKTKEKSYAEPCPGGNLPGASSFEGPPGLL